MATLSPGGPEGAVLALHEDAAGLPARRTVDLDGAVVLPGFIDSHVHLAWAGLKAQTLSVAPSRHAADVYQLAHESGGLPVRLQLMRAAGALDPVDTAPEDATNRAITLGLRTGFGAGESCGRAAQAGERGAEAC